jgi:hypothetical protein
VNASPSISRSIFITGAASGIGRETALLFAWVPGLLLKTLNYLGGALPFVSRPTMRMVDRRRG